MEKIENSFFFPGIKKKENDQYRRESKATIHYSLFTDFNICIAGNYLPNFHNVPAAPVRGS